MASSEHLELADYIKLVHQTLREDAETLGSQKAWELHCQNEDKLKKYAVAMEHLATNHWEKNCNKTDTKAISRVEWVYNTAHQYFFDGGILHQRNKDLEISHKLDLQLNYCDLQVNKKLNLLDVGSCYNPFAIYDAFIVLPIDIAPAKNEVFKCDFLTVEISHDTLINKNEVFSLQQKSFEIVVFSLLLEYMPDPKQRLLCCEKAYNLLKTEGLLIIITPDSKHVGANAKLMKSWQYILAKIGFTRIKYEKLPHLHCMAFRKSLRLEIAARWSCLHQKNNVFTEMHIPQDFNKPKLTIDKTQEKITFDINCINELPLEL